MRRAPTTLFAELAAGHDRMFWLDGGGSRDWSGRRSIIGFLDDHDVSLTYDASTREVRRHRSGEVEIVGDDVFDALAEALARDKGDPSVSWVGFFGYASRPELPATIAPAGPARVPDAIWMRARNPLVLEHDVADGGPAEFPGKAVAPNQPRSFVARRPGPSTVATASPENPPMPESRHALEERPTPAEYAAAFDQVQAELYAGNSYEVNLTYRDLIDSDIDPVTAYLRLRRLNPAPYAGYLQHKGTHLLSSSPERFATVDRHRWVETKPIKGTTPRGQTPLDDERLAASLRTDQRFRAENLMIVDLLRNDLSMVCEPGTVTVPAMMQVESYPSVHQLVSTVRGHLRDDVTTVQALRALFPAGSMTGAPKLRTMQIIAEVESTPRGVYAGAFGWVSGDGRADLGVVIRTLIAVPERAQGPEGGLAQTEGRRGAHRYELGTGGGITVRSDVAGEYAETAWKAARLRATLE